MGAAASDVALETADVALHVGRVAEAAVRDPPGARDAAQRQDQRRACRWCSRPRFLVMAITGAATLWMAVLADTGRIGDRRREACGCCDARLTPDSRFWVRERLRLAVREEVRLRRSRRWRPGRPQRASVNCHAHADAAVRPRDLSLAVDVASGRRQTGTARLTVVSDRSSGLVVRIARPPPADVERQRGGDGVAEAVGDGNAEHRARARPPVEAVRKQVRCSDGTMCCTDGVFVDVAGDAKGRQFAHFVRALAIVPLNTTTAGCGPVELAQIARSSSTPLPCGSRRSSSDQIDWRRRVRASGPAVPAPVLRNHRPWPAPSMRCLETVAHEGGVVGDEHRLHGRDRSGGHCLLLSAIRASGSVHCPDLGGRYNSLLALEANPRYNSGSGFERGRPAAWRPYGDLP